MIFLVISFVTRLIFFVYSFENIDKSFLSIIMIFLTGTFYDSITALYCLVPLVFILLILPEKIHKNKYSFVFFLLILFGYLYYLTFNVISEYLFWQEIEVRFNFIAVDYLLYTHEVIGNIRESYNLSLIFSFITTFVFILTMLFMKKIKKYTRLSTDLKTKSSFTLFYFLLTFTAICYIDSSNIRISENVYNKEVSQNGIYQLFHAFRHNTLDYDKYYIQTNNPFIKLKEFLKINKKQNFDITRRFTTNFPENVQHKKNIILITVESLSGDFIGHFGNTKNLTANIDDLAEKGLFLTNLFATGTRTVRGMEAITLSIPPTPGRSIVKRANNENLNSIGFILKDNGYNTKFIYSGYGYFDNMNYFYKNNGFDIVDRTSVIKKDISFSNIWGICDQDIYNQTIKEADKLYSEKKPFYFHVMTTSNHRPYTYPENLVDIPSGTGRDGAVKYTDYAIGELIRNAEKKEWMKDTIIIITADHCASSAGKTTINAEKYHIPLIMYSPGNIKPEKINKICSQIDLAPTILDYLGIEYSAKFFGNSILSEDFNERAFLGNYQSLGFLNSDGKLSVISPTRRYEFFNVNFNNNKETTFDLKDDKSLLDKNIVFYQTADYLFNNNLYKYDGKKNESNI